MRRRSFTGRYQPEPGGRRLGTTIHGTQKGRRFVPQRPLKKFGGEAVIPGNIIARQRGTKWHPGTGVGMGRDHTIFAVVEGSVGFQTKRNGRIYISVTPAKLEAAE